MGDDIYDENLSYKPNIVIPKLNGLSMIKTGSNCDLKETSVHKNGYIHRNEVKISRSGSQIMFLNAAMYIEKVATPQNYSRGDGKYKQNEKPSLNLDSIKDVNQLTNKASIEEPLRHINGIVRNGAGDRLSSPIRCTTICEPSKISCDQTQNSDSQTSSFRSISNEEGSSIASCSEEDSNNTRITDRYVEKSSVDQHSHLILDEKVEEPIKSLQRLLYRSYSDIDRGKALPVAFKTSSSVVSSSVVETNLNSQCSALGVPRRCSVRLSDSNCINTFPEKNIRKKILNALAEKGDMHYVTIECKGLLPHNWENLISFEDVAWFRWYLSKLEHVKRQNEARRTLDSIRREEEERERELRLHKHKLDEENLRAWMDRKNKEDAERREQCRRLELEKQKQLRERERIQKIAVKSRNEWNKKKDSERREQKLKEEQIRQQKEEEKRLRALKNKEAFELWNEKTKNRPKPMSVAIKDHKGRSDPTLARLNWNPIPWKNEVDESKENVPKDPGKRKKLMKPCSTR